MDAELLNQINMTDLGTLGVLVYLLIYQQKSNAELHKSNLESMAKITDKVAELTTAVLTMTTKIETMLTTAAASIGGRRQSDKEDILQ